MGSLIKKIFSKKNRKSILIPQYQKRRPPCPFYGFHLEKKNKSTIFLLDQEGSECGLSLKLGSESPHACLMEEIGIDQDRWTEYCDIYKYKKLRVRVFPNLIKVRVFPKEFFPNRNEYYDGISLRDWINYVIDIEKRDYK